MSREVSPDDLLAHVAGALTGARSELLAVSEAAHDVATRVGRRVDDLDDLRNYVHRLEDLQHETAAVLAHARDAAGAVDGGLRRDRDLLENLLEHPTRAMRHLRAADDGLRRLVEAPDLDPETRTRLLELREQLTVMDDAVTLTRRTVTDSSTAIERTQEMLRPLTAELDAGHVVHAGTAPQRAGTELGQVHSQARRAGLTSESATQNALAAARVADAARDRISRRHPSPPQRPVPDHDPRAR